MSMCYQLTWARVWFVQGVGGAVQYPKNYLKEAYKLVRERGGVCIADEVRVTFCIFLKFLWMDLLFAIQNIWICTKILVHYSALN